MKDHNPSVHEVAWVEGDVPTYTEGAKIDFPFLLRLVVSSNKVVHKVSVLRGLWRVL